MWANRWYIFVIIIDLSILVSVEICVKNEKCCHHWNRQSTAKVEGEKRRAVVVLCTDSNIYSKKVRLLTIRPTFHNNSCGACVVITLFPLIASYWMKLSHFFLCLNVCVIDFSIKTMRALFHFALVSTGQCVCIQKLPSMFVYWNETTVNIHSKVKVLNFVTVKSEQYSRL